MKLRILIIRFALAAVSLSSCQSDQALERQIKSLEKIYGMTLESPPRPIPDSLFNPIAEINVNYICIVPYAYTPNGSSNVVFNNHRQWWGEREEGVLELINMSQSQNMKLMLKPQVWLHEGWVGDFTLDTDEKWILWQNAYKEYILFFAEIAERFNVEIFCVGTEYKQVTTKQPQFWISLISEVRKVYSGNITYAANWDEYNLVNFWNKVDFIGVNAYFPLSPNKNPTVKDLESSWLDVVPKLKEISSRFKKPILFTEFGYRSVEFNAGNQWEIKQNAISLKNQTVAYEAFFNTMWKKSWVAGGFVWKWEFDAGAGGSNDIKYTPQGKPALTSIKNAYNKE